MSTPLQAVAGAIILGIGLLMFGSYLGSMRSEQQAPRTVSIRTANTIAETRAALLNDTGPIATSLRSAPAQTFPVAGGGSVSVSVSGSSATITGPDGANSMLLTAKSAGN